jgi:hypothetical protein
MNLLQEKDPSHKRFGKLQKNSHLKWDFCDHAKVHKFWFQSKATLMREGGTIFGVENKWEACT